MNILKKLKSALGITPRETWTDSMDTWIKIHSDIYSHDAQLRERGFNDARSQHRDSYIPVYRYSTPEQRRTRLVAYAGDLISSNYHGASSEQVSSAIEWVLNRHKSVSPGKFNPFDELPESEQVLIESESHIIFDMCRCKF